MNGSVLDYSAKFLRQAEYLKLVIFNSAETWKDLIIVSKLKPLKFYDQTIALIFHVCFGVLSSMV